METKKRKYWLGRKLESLGDRFWELIWKNRYFRAAVCFGVALFLFGVSKESGAFLKYGISAFYFIAGVYSLFPKFTENVGVALAGLAIVGCTVLLGQFVDPILPNINPIALAIIVGAIIIACAINSRKQ